MSVAESQALKRFYEQELDGYAYLETLRSGGALFDRSNCALYHSMRTEPSHAEASSCCNRVAGERLEQSPLLE